jgi:hypothetical protein
MDDLGVSNRVLVISEIKFEVSNVVVDVFGRSKLFEAFRVDIEEVWGKGDGFSSEVWEDAKSCDWSMQHRAIEFAKDVGTSVVSFDYDERAEISRSHLPV